MSRGGGSGESLVLAFDTSAAACSTALLTLDGSGGARLLTSRGLSPAGAQTRLLLPLFEEVLAEVGASPLDLRALVVGTGPGTFTGVRIGVASARAAAFALGVPVVGVSSLAALAAATVTESAAAGDEAGARDTVVPLVDARRGQLFGCVYRRVVPHGVEAARDVWRRVGPVFAADPGDVPAAVRVHASDTDGGRVVFVGRTDLLPNALPGTAVGSRTASREVDAAFLVLGQENLEGPGDGGLEGTDLLRYLSSVSGEGRWEGAAVRPGDLGTPEAVRPAYVRPPDADLHITKMKDPWA